MLEARGFGVAVADFAADMTGQPPYYARLVRSATASVAGDSAILVVHSGAGSLVPAIAASCRISGAIFVDALMPHPGQSWLETVPPMLKSRLEKLSRDGRVPPWHRWWPDGAIRGLFTDEAFYARFVAELTDIPLAFLEERAPDGALPQDFAAAYLQLGPGNAAEASTAGRSGWPVQRLALHHLALLTHPKEVAGAIADLAPPLQR